MFIRRAVAQDISAGAFIYREAKRYMKEAGNPTQWEEDGYPSEWDIEADIADGSSYVLEDGGEVVAVFHFHIGKEPIYEKLYGGEWHGSAPYGVIHRIAVKYHGRGLADFCFKECKLLAGSIRIDTYKDNLPMQRCLMKNGFSRRGTVYLENGEERIAFELI